MRYELKVAPAFALLKEVLTGFESSFAVISQ